MISHTKIVKAIRSEWRNKTAKQKIGKLRELRSYSNCGVRTQVVEDLDTASWTFDCEHKIAVGQQIDGMINPDTAKKGLKLHKFIKSLIWHECAHGRHTLDNSFSISVLAKELQDKGCPFYVFNVTEDCYIEAKEQQRTGDRFGWKNYLRSIPTDTADPCQYLLTLKFNEAKTWKSWRQQAPKWNGVKEVTFRNHKKNTTYVLKWFYDMLTLTAAIDLETRLSLTLEFYEVFKDQIQPVNTRKGDVGWYDDSIGGIQDPDSVQRHNLNNNPNGTYSKPNDMDWDLWPFKDGPASDYVKKTRDRICNSMTSIAANHRLARARSASTGSRIRIQSAMTGSGNPFLSVVKRKTKRKLFVVVDMSGSMSIPLQFLGGIEFVSALRLLDEKGIADVDIVFTSEDMIGDMSNVSSKEILRARPSPNREAMQSCLVRYRSRMENADTAIVFTDAAITDSTTDFEKFRGKVDLIGCCLRDKNKANDYAKSMQRWFKTIVVSENPIQLARLICDKLMA
tara:strand:- start:20702 stop:22228 length:1527 start_codon:yes stop_codon:yes gene_type:complete